MIYDMDIDGELHYVIVGMVNCIALKGDVM